MDTVGRDIFRAIHEGKWLSIEYRNQKDDVTKYWVGIISLNPRDKSMQVQGMHLGKHTTMQLKIFVDSIQSSFVIEGSYYETDPGLKEDIQRHPSRYEAFFQNVANLKILNYLIDCHKLDSVPYKTEYALIQKFDADCIREGNYQLTREQFHEIVTNFQYKNNRKAINQKIKQLALNVLSIHTQRGLYVMAYRELKLDVIRRSLRPMEDITICTEFTTNGMVQSIRRFLDAEDYVLLNDFEKNGEKIKDQITRSSRQVKGVDDMPYLIAIGRDIILDLREEYEAILDMYQKDTVTAPIKAFFGGLVQQIASRKVYPVALLNKQINLDQLLAIHNAMKYPLAYIQGPPGTGKTNTIGNTIITAFFNEKTVLFASYNNHPIDEVCQKLQHMQYGNRGDIPFPMIRLGSDERVLKALEYVRELCYLTEEVPVYDNTLKRNKSERIARTRKLTSLLQSHEERLNLLEKQEAIESLMESNNHLTFQTQLQGEQLAEVKRRLDDRKEVTDEEALGLVLGDEEEFKKYLYFISVKYIQRLREPKYKDLMDIVMSEDDEGKVKAFNSYIKKEENLEKFQRVFPVIATTSISAHKIGKPGTYFDMVIMDEASQGDIATSLVPIIRGKNLMLVGDPQQLSPVILLNPLDNAKLRKIYQVTEEYDYIRNSIYKTYLACDSVSREILLSHHYRCDRQIINFNNSKYYNNKLLICSKSGQEQPLKFMDIQGNSTQYKNTAPAEVAEILDYVMQNKDKNIGIITPFVNQRELINQKLKEHGLQNVSCGTVHAFQGDEKDVVLFSLALTDKTTEGSYDWLKNNRELINVAVSRARDQLIVLSSSAELQRLHKGGQDDLYELVQYVRSNGATQVTPRETSSRALGIKPYSNETEQAFLENLNHALDNVLNTNHKCVVQKEVAVANVLGDYAKYRDLFWKGKFDFVVFERESRTKENFPILAIELGGHARQRGIYAQTQDEEKNRICREHGFELIQVENSYVRRYNHMKDILVKYFKGVRGL